MSSEQKSEYVPNRDVERDALSSALKPMALQPFSVQLTDIFPIEISATRFPIAIHVPVPLNLQLNITEIGIDADSARAQVSLEVKVEPSDDSHAFGISFKLVGLFLYNVEYTQEMVQQFLQQGSLSLMLPFARELVLSLSTRLQIPPIVLSLIQLAPPSLDENE
jgi:preprotein translocase subunit SecB